MKTYPAAKLWGTCGIAAALAAALSGFVLQAVAHEEVLTNATDVITLPEDRAALRVKVQVTGVVTAEEPTLGGSFFIQDPTGGIFVDNRNGPLPSSGTLVRVTGVTERGAYAPVIIASSVLKLGSAPLPTARLASMNLYMSGAEDSQRLEISGIVRDAQMSETESNLDLIIASDGYRFHAFPKLPPNLNPQTLIGAKVRLRGTAAAFFDQLRRLTAVKLFMPLTDDFVVVARESGDPFAEAILPLHNVGGFGKNNTPDKRIHVRGVITWQRPGEELFIQDPTGGLRVKSRQAGAAAVGDVIEAAGFADLENHLSVLNDAVFRKSAVANMDIKPRAVPIQDVVDGYCDAMLVTLQGKLLDGFLTRDRPSAGGQMRSRTVLLLQGENMTFNAETDSGAAQTDFADLSFGSEVEVTGVCFTDTGEDGKARSFQILMPTGKGVRVLARPSWLTPQRLMTGLGILFVILVAAVAWTVMVSRRNRALKVLVGEKEKARVELREAHDQLEERVKERTAQLKLQITARKELELQSKATLAERTRLAQELHDTLEQALTGVALELDTTSRLFDKELENARNHLEIARNLVEESQTEVHRSVWNLRCRALEQFDLAGALLMSSQQIAGSSGLHMDVKASGRVRPLPEIVEENLLRIAQEALTNVVKHSGATSAKIDLDYGPQNIVLEVKDNGHGFEFERRAGAREGHFGLLGISERAKRLQGSTQVFSTPGAGTTVRVQIPLPGEAPVPGRAEPQMAS